MSTMLVVPPGVVGYVREGLYGMLEPVCASLAQARAVSAAGQRRGWQREPLAWLDRVGALLDVVGRSAGESSDRVMVDVDEHGWALLEALGCAVRVLDRLADELIVYQPGGARRRQFDGKLRVLRGFTATVEDCVLAGGSTRVDARPWAGLGGRCVGDIELVERALFDVAPAGRWGLMRRQGHEPSARLRRRDDFAACCLHARG
jgi:hypothetical protein